MTLNHLSEPELIASGGGDPWAINQTVQAGRPFQISRLAEAFYAAGRHTAEADHAFQIAQKRFGESWNHQNGDNPINDSAEVQRLTKSLGAQSEQLPKIGADLENIAAALADAQKQGAAEIANLDRQLQFLDKLYGAAQADLRDPSLPPKEVAKLHMIMDAAHADAVDDVRDAVKQMHSIRNAYSDTLHKALGSLHTEGYDPPANVDDTLEQPLRGEVRDLGPIAGTGAVPGIPGIGAADLGEIVEVPGENGQPTKFFAIFGDSFTGDKAYDGKHYPSVAVPVTFDAQGRPHFGAPLTGDDKSNNVLFPPPPEAGKTNTLPAGSIRMSDGTTYMMVAGTDNLNPTGGTWLVKVTGDPGQGWKPIDKSWRPWTPNLPHPNDPIPPGTHPGTAPGSQPTQISGFQAKDGKVYIAADSFDRSQGVTMYRVDPDQVTDRSKWQPWNGSGWGNAGDPATVPVSQTPFGELSFREVDGKPVLSAFNQGTGNVEVRVADDPTKVMAVGPTVVVQQSDPHAPNFLPQNYGGFILPQSTLSNLNLLVSQWDTNNNTPYNTREFHVDANR
ncbi:hypothetical protein A5697_15865 [Mycobacterium sp. E3251]|uniref:putative alpha/beta hydrolase n=1 Tax=unclassified Mycobacterium TaxID=2642494 RepID=UPI0007FE738F|nr:MULTISPECIES: DUF4185 domain-containing protein [unclassified Mycobacterium]OBG98608.1 hypothetical protein A5697_15865 [Mycobacterium sp. E3251]OBI38376.1 hypothetical protein A5711_11970 [Mycobacterium sp. E2238]